MEHLTKLVDMDLCFSCVVMDVWYFCKTLEGLGKDWVAQAKSNRRVKTCGRWVSLEEFAERMINHVDFKAITTW